MSNIRQIIRPIVRGAYDQQALRIQTGLRIVANFKAKLGQAPGETEEEALDVEAKELLAKLRASYRLIGTAVAAFKKTKGEAKEFVGDELISSEVELVLVEQYLDIEEQEKRSFVRLGKLLERVPIYQQYLSKIPGIGPAMGGAIVSEFDIHKARHPSSMWMYAGLDVAEDGKGRSRKAEHLVDREYTNKDGEQAIRKSITFNPWLKSKLLGVLAGSFLKAKNVEYTKIYQDYKNRLENHPKYKDSTKKHRHNMSQRYMIKQFLVNLHYNWRKIEGLPTSIPYAEAKLGLKHGEDKAA